MWLADFVEGFGSGRLNVLYAPLLEARFLEIGLAEHSADACRRIDIRPAEFTSSWQYVSVKTATVHNEKEQEVPRPAPNRAARAERVLYWLCQVPENLRDMTTKPHGRSRMIDIRSLRIRRMQADDPSALASAFADMNKSRAQFERYWQENVDGKRVTLVALLDGRVVGYTNVIWESDYESFRQQGIPEVNDMNTVTALRRNGIGTCMLKAAEELVHQKGMRVIGIGVGVTPDYAIAQKLYPKLGYVSDGTGVHPDDWGGCMYSIKNLSQEAKDA